MEKILLEIRSGEGGTDSKLFIKDMYKMYVSYAKKNNMELECL
jgi:protein subunit release factor A